MGRGDMRTAKGKRTRGSYGITRNKKKLKSKARAAAKPKKEPKPADTTPTA